MSTTKKRKSDVNIENCGVDNTDHPHLKKDRRWFEDANEAALQAQSMAAPTNRRKSFFGGVMKRLKSTSNIKDSKHKSTSKLDSAFSNNDTHLSIHSESSVTSAESSNLSTLPNIEKNAGLRTFLNRDSCTPVPSSDNSENVPLPILASSNKIENLMNKKEDCLSISSRISIDTIESNNTIDEDSMSITSASAFCTPLRSRFNRSSNSRVSTRSVPDPQCYLDDVDDRSLFKSLCNSAVRRVPSSKSDSGGGGNGGFQSSGFARRSIKLQLQRRLLNATSMEDVPEEEALAVIHPTDLSKSFVGEIGGEEDDEKFVDGKVFFSHNMSSTENMNTDPDSLSMSSQKGSTSIQELKKTNGSNSIGRNSSIFRKMFSGTKHVKERRMSETCESEIEAGRRRVSMLSENGICESASFVSNASSDQPSFGGTIKPKLRKKTISSSNITQRLSSVFRRSSTSTNKDEDLFGLSVTQQGNRRNTLTGYSSISSGIGSIASGISDHGGSAENHQCFNGVSVSRNGSRKENDVKKEKVRRFLEKVIVSDVPAQDLIKLKIEQNQKKEQKTMEEQFETQLNESGSSTSSSLTSTTLHECLNFDVVAVDVNMDGTPYSQTSSEIVDEKIAKKIKYEIKTTYRPDRCGTIVECDPDLIFVCPDTSSGIQNTSILGDEMNPKHVVDIRIALSKTIELWKEAAGSRQNSTILWFPMFCSTSDEWDSAETIEAIFKMLDALVNTKRWVKNGKCVLAGLTANNTKLIKEKYEALKLSIKGDEEDEEEEEEEGERKEREGEKKNEASKIESEDTKSINSCSTVLVTKV